MVLPNKFCSCQYWYWLNCQHYSLLTLLTLLFNTALPWQQKGSESFARCVWKNCWASSKGATAKSSPYYKGNKTLILFSFKFLIKSLRLMNVDYERKTRKIVFLFIKLNNPSCVFLLTITMSTCYWCAYCPVYW